MTASAKTKLLSAVAKAGKAPTAEERAEMSKNLDLIAQLLATQVGTGLVRSCAWSSSKETRAIVRGQEYNFVCAHAYMHVFVYQVSGFTC